MPRQGQGWKEAGFDTSPPPRPIRDRKRWLEMYVGWCYGRLKHLDAVGQMPKEDIANLKAWMLDPQWLETK